MQLRSHLFLFALGACALDATGPDDGASKLGLSSDHAVDVTSVRTAFDGSTHTRVTQRYKGIPVIGGTATIHTDTSGAITTSDATVHDLDVDITPKISVDQARVAATAPTSADVELAIEPIKERVRIAPMSEDGCDNAANFARMTTGARLVYRVTAGEMASIVDATTGALVDQRSTVEAVSGLLNTAYSGSVVGTITQIGSQYWMADPSRGGMFAWDPFETNNTPITKPVGTGVPQFGDGEAFVQGSSLHSETAAADAYFGIQVVWDMFDNVLSWTGMNGDGAAPVVKVHDAASINNAVYHPSDDHITVGDNANAIGGTMATIDIVGHEFAHGVDHYTAHLGGNPEADGMNEGNSDIFGVLSHIYLAHDGFKTHATTEPDNNPVEIDSLWIEGYDLTHGGGGRSMVEPAFPYFTADIETVGAHTSLGPLDRMFFFLAQGSSQSVTSETWSHSLPWGMQGVGNDMAARVWFIGLALFLQSDASYTDARAAAISAARFLTGTDFTSTEKAVRNAFAGVDVGDPAVNAPTPPHVTTIGTGHGSETTAQAVAVTSTGPVAGWTKGDATASGHTTKDDISVALPCGKTLGARLESSGASFETAAFDGGTELASGATNRLGDLVMTVAPVSCATRPAARSVFIRMVPGTPTGTPRYTMHLDIH